MGTHQRTTYIGVHWLLLLKLWLFVRHSFNCNILLHLKYSVRFSGLFSWWQTNESTWNLDLKSTEMISFFNYQFDATPWNTKKRNEESEGKRIFNLNSLNGICSIDCCLILTFLNTSRVAVILPKHSSSAGCCTIAMIVGSIRFILSGNEYQSNCSMVKSISSNASLILWPSSHTIKTVTSARIPQVNIIIIGISLSWCTWNRQIK